MCRLWYPPLLEDYLAGLPLLPDRGKRPKLAGHYLDPQRYLNRASATTLCLPLRPPQQPRNRFLVHTHEHVINMGADFSGSGLLLIGTAECTSTARPLLSKYGTHRGCRQARGWAERNRSGPSRPSACATTQSAWIPRPSCTTLDAALEGTPNLDIMFKIRQCWAIYLSTRFPLVCGNSLQERPAVCSQSSNSLNRVGALGKRKTCRGK